MDRIRSLLSLSPSKITAVYVIVSSGYIITSDVLLADFAQTSQGHLQYEIAKGTGFVLVSGLLIFGLTRYREIQLRTTRTGYQTVNEQLHVIHRVLRHNIRNNLNIVTGYIGLVQEHTDDAQIREHLAKADAAVDEFIKMANKLKIIDDIDPLDPDHDPINIVPILDRSIQSIKDEHPAVTITTDMPSTAYVEGGPPLAIVFDELLENAVRHNDVPDHCKHLECAVITDPERVTIVIEDDGPGIPPGELDAINQGIETALTHASGTGLWVVTWLIRLLDGSIDFDTDPEDGTTVSLTFYRTSKVDYAGEVLENELAMPEVVKESAAIESN